MSTEGNPSRTVVVGYDGSAHSGRALDRAAAIVGERGTVVVVTATPSITPSLTAPDPILDAPSPRDQRELLEHSRMSLERHGVRGRYVAAGDDPADALAEAARSAAADLIVVGRTGSGFVTRALLGSTSENVIRRSPCDVLVVI
jgi:nucleotide-binding universal stress UspA family protein